MDRFKLKIIMIVFMLFGNIAFFIKGVPFWFNFLGTMVMPVFLYLLVEGYFKTSSREKYLKRLMVASGVMFIGDIILSLIFFRGINGAISLKDYNINIYIIIGAIVLLALLSTILIINTDRISDKKSILYAGELIISTLIINYLFDYKVEFLRNNIFLTFVTSFILLNTLEEIKGKKNSKALIKALMVISLALMTEGMIIGPFLTYLFYKCRNDKKTMYKGIIVISALFIGGFNFEALIRYPQWMMVFSIIFIHFYNGKKGKDMRWLFYGFYPIHIWILYIISSFI